MTEPTKRRPCTSRQLVIGGLLCALLVASHLWFLKRPNHRLGGIAWNALFQMFGPLLALGYAAFLAIRETGSSRARTLKILVCIALVAIATACWLRTWPVMISV